PVHAPHRPLCGACAEAACARRGAELLVGLPVAVVIRAVTDLGRRIAGRAAVHTLAIHALDRPLCGADAGAAGARRGAEILVGLPVAVVVQAVTELGRGIAGRAAVHALAVDALDRPLCGARAGAACARRGAEIVVGLAVAIVVQAVTKLGRGIAGRAAVHALAVDALDRPLCGACAEAAGARRGAELLVGLPVAIVVQAVTELGRRIAGRAAVH